MQSPNFIEVLERILGRDARYSREAYLFLREALDYTQVQITKGEKSEPRHVTGQELLEGIRRYALAQFGPMSRAVLHEWGIRTCCDFGEIVFNMVEQGLLSKTEKDTRGDFEGGYDFDEAFCKPFRPSRQEAPGLESQPNTSP